MRNGRQAVIERSWPQMEKRHKADEAESHRWRIWLGEEFLDRLEGHEVDIDAGTARMEASRVVER